MSRFNLYRSLTKKTLYFLLSPSCSFPTPSLQPFPPDVFSYLAPSFPWLPFSPLALVSSLPLPSPPEVFSFQTASRHLSAAEEASLFSVSLFQESHPI